MILNRYVVIMAGGSGERFWPQSRQARPKHLQAIVGEQPMLAQTVARIGAVVPIENIFVITNAVQRPQVLEVCPELLAENVVGEPVGRDTSAAVGLATELVRARNPQGVLAMLPADAVIHDAAGFQKILGAAFAAAESAEVLVTIGITPTMPATGYGYIHRGKAWHSVDGQPFYHVQRFVEKPDLERAKTYLQSGEYFWNAGMFVWTVTAIDAAFRTCLPDLHAALGRIGTALSAGEPTEAVLAREYPGLQKISVDYGIMEKAQNVVTVPAAFDWDDVGEWPAIARHYPQDAHGNTVKGYAEFLDASNNIVVSEDGHLTAVLGLDDLIVVRTADATLICPRSRAQDIKHLVKALSQRGEAEAGKEGEGSFCGKTFL